MPYINPNFEELFTSTGNQVTQLLIEELEPSRRLKNLEGSNLRYPISREYLQKGIEFEYEFVARRGMKSGSPPKRIRPAIVIYTGLGNGCTDKDALQYASMAVELLHNMALVHDDIMDLDETRSNEPTVRKRWYDFLEGKVPEEGRWHVADSMTINSGDRLMQLPYQVISRSKFDDRQKILATGALTKAMIQITHGQDLDMSFAGKVDDIIAGRLLDEEIYGMYELKTGALFELCAHLGLIFSNGTEEQMLHASNWAIKYFNPRFQIKDDLIEDEILGKKGKEVGRDIVEGKLTPLVIKTLKKGPKYSKPLLEVLGNKNATEQQIIAGIDAIRDSGAVEGMIRVMDDMGKKGKDEIKQMGLKEPYSSLLVDLTEYVGVRTH